MQEEKKGIWVGNKWIQLFTRGIILYLENYTNQLSKAAEYKNNSISIC